ncbi:MAG: plastocyanin/azurin family copper-binding protein, partial [Halolamina sp.]
GTTVEWTNKDGASHDVTSDTFTEQGSEWDYYSGSLGNGAVTSYTFTEAGAYEYYCSIHGAASMCGVVIVGDASHDATLPCE